MAFFHSFPVFHPTDARIMLAATPAPVASIAPANVHLVFVTFAVIK